MSRFRDKTVVILGASAEGGTGWRTAELFAHEGADVVVAARTLAGIQALARKIGGRAVLCDAANEDQIHALAEIAASKTGQIDIAVNAAGLPVPGTIETLDVATLQRSVEVNYFGQLFFVRQMAAKMRAGGSVSCILSLASTHPQIGVDGYAFAKSAALAMVRYAGLEYASRGIRINAINPGLIDTPMAAPVCQVPAIMKVFLQEIPLKKAVDPADVGRAALWLAEAESVTGACIEIDGGAHLGRWPRLDELPTAALTDF